MAARRPCEGLGHPLHVDGRVVPPRSEPIDARPEIRLGGEAELGHAGALTPDGPRLRVQATGLREPAVALVRLPVPDQVLPESKEDRSEERRVGKEGRSRWS